MCRQTNLTIGPYDQTEETYPEAKGEARRVPNTMQTWLFLICFRVTLEIQATCATGGVRDVSDIPDGAKEKNRNVRLSSSMSLPLC